MTLSFGTKLGPYEILSPLGAGGMGEVYRAKDTKLGRDVAIKVLPDVFAREPERLQRFQREAKLLASLNHPNIAAIYGFEENLSETGATQMAGATHFLVMELVEGKTLSELIKTNSIPVEESLAIARQIAEALEAAHEQGVIHRDLKPANVMVREDNTVKVLDFGLAKAIADDPSATTIANSPTITAGFTRAGVILGTAAYMSPEQARGRPLDKRTDIWSFGCVLYECLTGSLLFGGETASDSIGAILHKTPDWLALPPDTPPTVQLLLRKCLTKDRNQRLRDIGDARIEIVQAIADPTSSTLSLATTALADTAHAKKSLSKRAFTFCLIVLLAGACTLGGWYLKPASAPFGRVLSEIPPPPNTRILYAGDVAGPAVVSPDGTMLAFVAQERGNRQQIWIQRLNEKEPRPLRGTDRADFPFWSPNSKSLGFFLKNKLMRVDLATGTATTICDIVGGRGGAWLNGDVIVLAPQFQKALFRVAASGGTPEELTELDPAKHTSHRWPARVGDGNHFLFSAINHDPSKAEENAIYLGALDGTPPHKVMHNMFNAEYAIGRILFVRDTVLMAAPLDLTTGKLAGDPVSIVADVTPDRSTWRAAFSASSAGVLAYHSIEQKHDSEKGASGMSLGVASESNVAVAYDRSGRPITQYADGVPQSGLRINTKAQMAVSAINDQGAGNDLWIYQLANAPGESPQFLSSQRATSMPFGEFAPVWSPDGTELAFAYLFVAEGTDAIYRKRIGGGVEHRLVEAPKDLEIWPTDWTSDGKYLIYSTGIIVTSTSTDIYALPFDGGSPIALVVTSDHEFAGRVSPNGKWLAYQAGSSYNWEVYVIPFAPDRSTAPHGSQNTLTEKWHISVGGGLAPCWSHDGKELFYMSAGSMLMAVAIDTEGDIFTVGATTPLFQTSFEPGKAYDVYMEGKRFIINEVASSLDTPISLIVNWQEALK